MRMLVVVLVNECLLDAMLLLVEDMADLMDQVFIRGDMQVDQRFQDLLAVIVLGDLEGDQGINVHHAQVQTVGRDGTEIGILGRIGTIGIEGISMAGIGEAKGDAECGLYLLFAQQATDTSAEAICAVEVQKTLKQYFANYFRDRQIAKEIVFFKFPFLYVSSFV